MDVKEYTDKQKQAMQMTMFAILDIISKTTDANHKSYLQGYYQAFDDIINGIDQVLENRLKNNKKIIQ